MSESVYNELEEGQDQSCLNYASLVELMSGYLKIVRPDKVAKIYKEISKAIEDKGT